jgi:hypothetical protein
MRNITAVILGIITSFVTLFLIFSLLFIFDIGPLRTFALGKFGPDQFAAILNQVYWQFLLIISLVSFVAGIVTALKAKNKEYFLGILSIFPMLLIYFHSFSHNCLLLYLSTFFFTITGIKTAKIFKTRGTPLKLGENRGQRPIK